MKNVGVYNHIDDDYDVDHEINRMVGETKKLISKIDGGDNYLNNLTNKTKVKKAMIETILESID